LEQALSGPAIHLTTWRAARERGELAAAPKKRGPVPRVPDPRDQRITELERESIRWRKCTERAEALVELQKQGQGCSAALTRRSASKRPWLEADNGLYVGYAHRRLTT
jgi:hypothetical protein